MAFSRRQLLKKSAAAAAAGTAALAAQGASPAGQAPTVVTARRFRAWVTRGAGSDRTTLQELTLRPIAGRHGNITLPGVLFSIGGRTHHAGQAGGSQPMRDIPRYVEMLDAGQFNARALATTVVRLEDMLPAYEQVAYRIAVTAIMTP